MTTVTDDQLYAHADRVKGKVVLITGAANGIGKETALQFAKYGAKIVIGDLDLPAAQAVIAKIVAGGGQGVAQKCDVLNWDDQVSLFELAENQFGSIDIVVPNAGVTEIGMFNRVKLVNGKPIKPTFKTLEINLVAVMYTAHLALHWLPKNRSDPASLKALVFLGSMASWQSIPGGACYSASKHAVLGFMRSLYIPLVAQNIRTGIIHPFFVDTAIVPVYVKVALAGIPLTPVERVAGAVVGAATDANMESSGCPWVLPDNGPVLRLEREQLKEGVYKMIDARSQKALAGIKSVQTAIAVVNDLWRLLGKQTLLIVVLACAGRFAYRSYAIGV